jgi:hypothetical protein
MRNFTLDGWQGSSLSIGGRLTLINACLSSIPIYAMSMYYFQKLLSRVWIEVGRDSSSKEGGLRQNNTSQADQNCKTKKEGLCYGLNVRQAV